MSRTLFSAKDPREEPVLTFEFSDRLEGKTITSLLFVSIETLTGTDPTPTAVLDAGVVVSGTKVLQPVKGGVLNCDYYLFAKVMRSDGRTVGCGAVLPVRKDGL